MTTPRDHLSSVTSLQTSTLSLLTSELPTAADQATEAVKSLAGEVTEQARALASALPGSLACSLVRSGDSAVLLPSCSLGINMKGREELGEVVSRLEELRRGDREVERLQDRSEGLLLEEKAGRLRAALREGRREQEEVLLPQLRTVEDERREGESAVGRVGELRQEWVKQEAGSVAVGRDVWGEVEGISR